MGNDAVDVKTCPLSGCQLTAMPLAKPTAPLRRIDKKD